MNRILVFLTATLFLPLAIFSQGFDVRLDTVNNYNGWGWKALIVDNGYIQLVVLPEIGGHVLHYGFVNDTYMAVNTAQMDKVYDPQTNQSGPWSSWGYGGYKVWPAPQSFWNWPPPPYLDWGNYTWTVEHASADSLIMYMLSSVESFKTPGLQQARRFKIYKNSSHVAVEQILKNVSSSHTEWSIWEVTQAIIDHDNTGDYENISVYFPSDLAGIKSLSGALLPTTEVEENVRKFNYSGNSQKIGMLLKEGWGCFVDERDEQTYAKIFDIYPAGTVQYSDKNTNFQLYVGGVYMEIEVLGPLTDIAQGDSSVYTENWYASHSKGNIYTANQAGAVHNRLSYNNANSKINGEYGIFNKGGLSIRYYSDANQELGTETSIPVDATDKLTLDQSITLPEGTDQIKILAFDAQDKRICVLDSCSVSALPSGIHPLDESACRMYPSLLEKGDILNIEPEGFSNGHVIIEIHSLSDGKLVGQFYFNAGQSLYQITSDKLESGVYLITMTGDSVRLRNRFIVK